MRRVSKGEGKAPPRTRPSSRSPCLPPPLFPLWSWRRISYAPEPPAIQFSNLSAALRAGGGGHSSSDLRRSSLRAAPQPYPIDLHRPYDYFENISPAPAMADIRRSADSLPHYHRSGTPHPLSQCPHSPDASHSGSNIAMRGSSDSLPEYHYRPASVHASGSSNTQGCVGGAFGGRWSADSTPLNFRFTSTQPRPLRPQTLPSYPLHGGTPKCVALALNEPIICPLHLLASPSSRINAKPQTLNRKS